MERKPLQSLGIMRVDDCPSRNGQNLAKHKLVRSNTQRPSDIQQQIPEPSHKFRQVLSHQGYEISHVREPQRLQAYHPAGLNSVLFSDLGQAQALMYWAMLAVNRGEDLGLLLRHYACLRRRIQAW